MDGDEGFEVAVALDEVHNIFHFDLRVGIGTVVGVGTGILAGSSTWEKMSIVKHEKITILTTENDIIYIPPKPASQFLLGSVPRQEEPRFTERVLRHIRF